MRTDGHAACLRGLRERQGLKWLDETPVLVVGCSSCAFEALYYILCGVTREGVVSGFLILRKLEGLSVDGVE